MSDPKRHHILPTGFQRLFSSNGEKKVWSIPNVETIETNSGNVAAVGKHYNFFEDGEVQKWVEPALNIRETKAIPVITKVKTTKSIKSLSHEERDTITGFLKLAICRFFEFHDQSDPSNDTRLLNDIRTAFRHLAALKPLSDSSDIMSKEFISESYYAAKKQNVLSDLPKVSNFLGKMRLSLIEAPNNSRFITGEHVFAAFNNPRSDTVIMPICPTLAVRWSSRDCSQLQVVDQSFVERVNKQIFAMSKFPIASEKEDLTALI